MEDVDLQGRRVLIRQDLNVPLQDGVITSNQRILASLPTIRKALEKGAAIILVSHLGRPEEGKPEAKFSLQPVADELSRELNKTVTLVENWTDGVEVKPGEVVLLENIRFQNGEKKDDDALAKKLAALCDVFVMDAFGTAHRAQASTHGVAKFAPIACAGPLLSAELDALQQALDKPAKPMVAIVGGSKVSTKLILLKQLINQVDQLVVGGGIANTFIAAHGYSVGKSLYEPDLVGTARELIELAFRRGAEIPIPTDVVCAKEFSAHAHGTVKSVEQVEADDLILDIGPDSAAHLAKIMKSAGTIVWNGPVGVFEYEEFSAGTRRLAHAIANSHGFSIAGGGDTVAAINQFGVADQISYISTGGGAFLEFLEGKTLPAVAILEARSTD